MFTIFIIIEIRCKLIFHNLLAAADDDISDTSAANGAEYGVEHRSINGKKIVIELQSRRISVKRETTYIREFASSSSIKHSSAAEIDEECN